MLPLLTFSTGTVHDRFATSKFMPVVFLASIPGIELRANEAPKIALKFIHELDAIVTCDRIKVRTRDYLNNILYSFLYALLPLARRIISEIIIVSALYYETH